MSDAPTIKRVISIKWGDRYGPHYVNRLFGMVARHLSKPFEFHCFTDRFDGLREEVICHDLPELGVPHPERTFGKWRKTALWGAELDGLAGPALFMDLDVVITGNLEPFFEYGEADDVVLARDWLRPLQRRGQSSIFRFPIGGNPYILEDFRRDAQGIADKYHWEQRYLTEAIRPGIKFWPEPWVRHYRYHLLGSYLRRYFLPARHPPAETRVVVFPGLPNPEDAVLGRWSSEAEPVSLRKHLLRCLTGPYVGGRLKTHLKFFQRPCPWVAEYWRE